MEIVFASLYGAFWFNFLKIFLIHLLVFTAMLWTSLSLGLVNSASYGLIVLQSLHYSKSLTALFTLNGLSTIICIVQRKIYSSLKFES